MFRLSNNSAMLQHKYVLVKLLRRESHELYVENLGIKYVSALKDVILSFMSQSMSLDL